MIDAALQTSGLCETSAPPRPTLRYGMETTDLLLCLGGVDTEDVPARRGGLGDLSFCFAPRGRRTYHIPSPLRGRGGMGQITTGAVTRDNKILVAIEAEDQHRMKKVDIYRCLCFLIYKKYRFLNGPELNFRTEMPVYVSGMIIQRRTAGWRCAQHHTGTCML